MYMTKKCDKFLLVEFHICFAFEYCYKILFDWVSQIVSSIISQMSIFMLRWVEECIFANAKLFTDAFDHWSEYNRATFKPAMMDT